MVSQGACLTWFVMDQIYGWVLVFGVPSVAFLASNKNGHKETCCGFCEHLFKYIWKHADGESVKWLFDSDQLKNNEHILEIIVPAILVYLGFLVILLTALIPCCCCCFCLDDDEKEDAHLVLLPVGGFAAPTQMQFPGFSPYGMGFNASPGTAFHGGMGDSGNVGNCLTAFGSVMPMGSPMGNPMGSPMEMPMENPMGIMPVMPMGSPVATGSVAASSPVGSVSGASEGRRASRSTEPRPPVGEKDTSDSDESY